MPIVIQPLPENERHRRDIEGQVERYLARGGEIRAYGVTPPEPMLSRREINQQVGRTRRGPKADT
jgi:hypothetical protein